MIKKSLEITPGIEPLYGTHDENIRLLEDGLHVTIDLRSDGIEVTGDSDSVVRVERVFSDFDYLRKSGVNLHNGELNGMLKLVVADSAVSLRSLVESPVHGPSALPFLGAARTIVRIPCRDWNLRIEPK